MGTTIKHPVTDWVKPPFVISDIRIPGTLTLTAARQSARMSKITNDGLTRSGTGCFIAVPYGNSERRRVNEFLLRVAYPLIYLNTKILKSIG